MKDKGLSYYFWKPLIHQYADFSGRTSRYDFWMFIGIYLAFALIASFISQMFDTRAPVVTLSVLMFLPLLAMSVRRLHDLGKSGWWTLIYLFPFGGPLIMLVFLVLKGQERTNEYGPDPLAPIDTMTSMSFTASEAEKSNTVSNSRI